MDFKAAERDGWEIPWPIAYAGHRAVLRPGRAADRRLRRRRRLRGAARAASSCSRRRRRAAASGCCRRATRKLGIPVVAGRRANMTRPTRGFPPCHYCGNCGAGCDTASFFCSADHLLPVRAEDRQARDSVERRRRRACWSTTEAWRSGVQYFDRKTGAERQVLGKVVVVGASCVDSTRILLNSKSTRYPNGLGNGSDVIGRYLCEQIRFNVRRLPAGAGRHADAQRSRHRRRAHLHAALQPSAPARSATTCAASARSSGTPAPATRRAPRQRADPRLRRRAEDARSSGGIPAWFEIHPFGEVLPYAHNRITVDAARRGSLRRAAAEDRLSDRRERAEDDRAHGRHGRGDRQGGGRRAGQLQARRSSTQRLGDPRARHLPHGRRTRSGRRSTSSTRCTR